MLNIIILAIIQALTEFIPVSSSGHLLALERLTSLESSLSLDVALHFGTLLALLAYFAPKLIQIVAELKQSQTLLINLILTSIPAALVGFFFEDFISTDVRSLGVVVLMLAVVGLIMLASESSFFKVDKQLKDYAQLTHAKALMIGFGQAMALIPGTSRSGITMLSAKKAGLSNKLAAEYAFLVGIPIIAGASLKVFIDPDTNAVLQDNLGEAVVGVVVAAVVGLIVLRYLISYVSRHGLKVFGWYRLVLAAILFIIWLNR